MLKGWFKFSDQDGDRTVDQQLVGLERIKWEGKTVLDLGCAEGLISKHAAICGAKEVHGVDVVAAHVARAHNECDGLPCTFGLSDLNAPVLFKNYDIVLMLAILHKLRNPTEAVQHYARFAKSLIVVRLPPKDKPWVIVDARSGGVPHNITAAMWRAGWAPSYSTRGTFDEYIAFYTRVA